MAVELCLLCRLRICGFDCCALKFPLVALLCCSVLNLVYCCIFPFRALGWMLVWLVFQCFRVCFVTEVAFCCGFDSLGFQLV